MGVLSREHACRILSISSQADRTSARAAMLARLHELIANQKLPLDSPSVREVETAYMSFIGSPAAGTITPKGVTEPPDPLPYPPWKPASTHPRKTGLSWKFWVGMMALVGSILLVWIFLAMSQSADANSGYRDTDQGSSRALPSLAPGITGEVGNCWKEVAPGSRELDRTNCRAESAQYRAISEVRRSGECSGLSMEVQRGWYLCLTRL